jgi:catalase
MARTARVQGTPAWVKWRRRSWNFREDDDDYYTQPGKLFRLMSPEQQQVLFENTARAMGDIPKEIKVRHIRNCMKADPRYGKGVADALGISLDKVT